MLHGFFPDVIGVMYFEFVIKCDAAQTRGEARRTAGKGRGYEVGASTQHNSLIEQVCSALALICFLLFALPVWFAAFGLPFAASRFFLPFAFPAPRLPGV